jgi:hypothetical protein
MGAGAPGRMWRAPTGGRGRPASPGAPGPEDSPSPRLTPRAAPRRPRPLRARSNNSFAGALPSEWAAGLPGLVELDLSNNKLDGSVPAAWGRLKFEALRVAGNAGLTGCLPRGIAALAAAAVRQNATAARLAVAGTGLQLAACA